MNTLEGLHAAIADEPRGHATRPVLPSLNVGEFLAMLGHEMRNPLHALSNALELWPSTATDALAMEGLRILMRRQVEQLVRFSEDLVDAARGNCTLSFHRHQVDLKRTVESACEEVRPYAERRGHILTLYLSAEPIDVPGDGLRLVQAIANLVQNAAKFMKQAGRIDVYVERREHWAAVAVRDNGAGIEAHRLPTIFLTHPVTSRECRAANDGLGIGLPLVKKIVDAHGGNIVAQSCPGQGSEFIVYLPAQSSTPPSEAPRS